MRETSTNLTHGKRSTYGNYGCRCAECKEAARTYSRGRRIANGLPVLPETKWGKAGERRALYQQLKDKPCADCGGSFPVVCMQYDHLPEYVKCFNISEAVRDGSATKDELLAEIAKCDVVCANCHAIRTSNRQSRHIVTQSLGG